MLHTCRVCRRPYGCNGTQQHLPNPDEFDCQLRGCQQRPKTLAGDAKSYVHILRTHCKPADCTRNRNAQCRYKHLPHPLITYRRCHREENFMSCGTVLPPECSTHGKNASYRSRAIPMLNSKVSIHRKLRSKPTVEILQSSLNYSKQ